MRRGLRRHEQLDRTVSRLVAMRDAVEPPDPDDDGFIKRLRISIRSIAAVYSVPLRLVVAVPKRPR